MIKGMLIREVVQLNVLCKYVPAKGPNHEKTNPIKWFFSLKRN